MNENMSRWMVTMGMLAAAGCGPSSAGGFTEVRLVRSATVAVGYRNAESHERRILVDPILADEGTEPPIDYSNERKNPTIGLPMDKHQLLASVDAILLTHYHSDHFDREAERIVPKDTLIFCQPYDEARLREKGFSNLRPVDTTLTWEGLTITRYSVSHHEGATGAPPFGESSSFALQAKGETVFFTGDAIFDSRLKSALAASEPRWIVANAGECQFTRDNPLLAPGVPMTLGAAALKEMAGFQPASKIVAVHMDAINHCPLTKVQLRQFVEKEGLSTVVVPNEGERVR